MSIFFYFLFLVSSILFPRAAFMRTASSCCQKQKDIWYTADDNYHLIKRSRWIQFLSFERSLSRKREWILALKSMETHGFSWKQGQCPTWKDCERTNKEHHLSLKTNAFHFLLQERIKWTQPRTKKKESKLGEKKLFTTNKQSTGKNKIKNQWIKSS